MYKVGTRLLTIKDDTRIEKLGPGCGPRYVTARVYYPAHVTDEKEIVIEGKAVGTMYDNPEIASLKKMPVIIYNHGYGSYMEANNLLCCQLAEKGYFVVSVGHAYEVEELPLVGYDCDDNELSSDSDKNKLSYIKLDPQIRKLQIYPRFLGTIDAIKMKKPPESPEEQYAVFNEYQKKYCSFLNERQKEWACDVIAVMKKVEEVYGACIDKERGYGITGHSYGGSLAYYMCQNYPEYKCGADMDGAIFGDYEGMTMEKPFLLAISKGNVTVTSKALIATKAPIVYEIIDGAAHLSFMDLKYYRPRGFMMGRISHEEISERMLDMHLKFFGEYLV